MSETAPLLEVENLHASAEGTSILRGLSLTVRAGEVHAVMGPNGSGKSTLSHAIAGRDGYDVESGQIRFRGEDVSEWSADERARAGIFLAFQYPVEIPGLPTMTFLRAALNARRAASGEEALSAADVLRRVREAASRLGVDDAMLKRPVNAGFSGGEKKRAEILQMAVLEPSLCILDETDSGLDIDALRIVSEGVNAMRSSDRGIVVITHYQRLLNYIVPDAVHVLLNGRVVRSGGRELALSLEESGYAEYGEEAA